MGPETRKALEGLPAETANKARRLQAEADKHNLPLQHQPGIPWSVAVASHYDWIAKHQKKSHLHDKLFMGVFALALISFGLHFIL